MAPPLPRRRSSSARAVDGIRSSSPGHARPRPPPPLPRPLRHGRPPEVLRSLLVRCAMVDFVNYLKSSLSSGEVKLLFAADQFRKSPGSDGAKLLATKAKGLPRITISLHSVTGAATSDAIAEFSLLLCSGSDGAKLGLHGSLHPKNKNKCHN
ncbi:uncharacterized protein [Aegilops tauschii subsp. strangulata]|nr:uncharacterized protein LOC109740183 [Aegilops tauschii subsp. strangulata]XP_045084249.1 uncharacterized protein LOC109740183 [Aegilops tauschii subsp. strangulata]